MQPFFLSVPDGQRFCLFHPAAGTGIKGVVLCIHPFAEEMNKSRHTVAVQARAFANAGFAVLQIDLFGCGDSSGEFGDATWRTWKDDVLLACRWLRGQSQAPLTLWGVRAGCLVVANAAAELGETANFVFWQPIVSGKQYWQQFMRLKMAGELATGQAKGVLESLRQDLAAGKPVEIIGYSVSPDLVDGLEQAELSPPGLPGRVAWFELSMREEASLAPASQKWIERWRGAGFDVAARVVPGPGFWQTAEIEDVPELVTATLVALEPVR